MRIYAFNMQHKFCNKVRKGDGFNPISIKKQKNVTGIGLINVIYYQKQMVNIFIFTGLNFAHSLTGHLTSLLGSAKAFLLPQYLLLCELILPFM